MKKGCLGAMGFGAMMLLAMSTCVTAATAVGQPLKMIGPWEIHSLDPSANGVFFTRLQVAETLVDADDKGELKPGLAISWQVSADRLSWRFALRKSAIFHDGTPVTAQAVVNSLERARRKPGIMDTAPIIRIGARQDEVVVELSRPFSPLAALFAHASTQILAGSAYAADGAVKAVIGSGPYKVSQLAQPQKIVVSAFDKWQGKRPAIREVSYLAVGRGEGRALMAESGQADIALGLDPVSLGRLKQNPRVRIVAVTLPRTILIKANAGHKWLGDVRVRRAISLAINRPAMAGALLRDPEMAATQLFPPSMGNWYQKGLAPLSYNPAEAGKLLAAAGWRAGGDGILTRNGDRFEMTLRTFPDRQELPPLATALQDQLRKVGIQLHVKIGNSSEVPAGHKDGSLELGMGTRNFALTPDPLLTLIDDYGNGGGDWGAMNWPNREITRTLQALAADGSGQGGKAGRLRVATILQAELPVIPVAWYRQSAAVSNKLRGVALDPLERSYRLTDMDWVR